MCGVFIRRKKEEHTRHKICDIVGTYMLAAQVDYNPKLNATSTSKQIMPNNLFGFIKIVEIPLLYLADIDTSCTFLFNILNFLLTSCHINSVKGIPVFLSFNPDFDISNLINMNLLRL